MNDRYDEPHLSADGTVASQHPFPALASYLDDSFTETCRLRHDGWDGEKVARFCEMLAQTGVVTEACCACGMSAKSAYALRHRDP